MIHCRFSVNECEPYKCFIFYCFIFLFIYLFIFELLYVPDNGKEKGILPSLIICRNHSNSWLKKVEKVDEKV